MKTIFFLLTFAITLISNLNAADFTGTKIYINPGHGGWDANDRNIETIPFALGDTLGFYESKSNLIKGLYLRDLLQAKGATVIMSRTRNRTEDDRSLSEIAAEANANNVDAFLSIHSNAVGTNTGTNYLLFLYHGPDNAPAVAQSLPMCVAAWPRLMSNKLTVWTHYTTTMNNRGDHTFYGNTTGLGVLRPLTVPGFLSEGSFHDYKPEAHRLLNEDYCKLEAVNFHRFYCDYFQKTLPTTGEIAGWVKSEDLQISHPQFTYINGSDDQWLPLNGARVKLMNAAGDSITQYIIDNRFNGIFMFHNLSPGTYRLRFFHKDHFSKETTVNVLEATTTYANTKMAIISSSSNALFSSKASGNWNDPESWTLSSGTDTDGIPDADDNVIIKSEYTISLSTNSACSNLTLEGVSTGTRLALGDNILEITGTLNGDGNTLSAALITYGQGKVKFTGNTRVVIGSSWSADLWAWRIEFALNTGQTGTTRTSISASDILISSGIIAVTGDLRPNNGLANTGSVSIQNGAVLSVTQRITRTATENTPFGSLVINGNGKLIINGTATNALAVVTGGFPVYTFSPEAQIEYQGGTQTIADISYPNLIIGAGTKTWTLTTADKTAGNIIVDGTAVFTIGGGSPVTVNGNITVGKDAIIGLGSSGNRFVAAGNGRIFTLNGTARITANETQTPAATHPFAYQINNFATYTFAPNSWISFRAPVTTVLTQGIDGIAGSPFGNVEVARFTSPTTENMQNYVFKTNIEMAGNLALVRRNDRTLMTFDFGANTIKVGGIITRDGHNLSNREIGRTYIMGSSTFEMNGLSVQNTLGGTDLPSTFNNLTINNPSGVSPQSALTVNGTLNLLSGKLNLVNNNITVGAMSGGSQSSYIVTSGTGRVNTVVAAASKTTLAIGTATTIQKISILPTTTTSISARVSVGVPSAAIEGQRFHNTTWQIESSVPSATEIELDPATTMSAGASSFMARWSGSAYELQTATKTSDVFKAIFSTFGQFIVGENDNPSSTQLVSKNIHVYSNKSTLYIVGISEGTNITVANLKGQIVVNQMSKSTANIFNLKSGVYVVSLLQNNDLITKKIIVN